MALCKTLGHFWSVAKVALRFGCAKQSKNLERYLIPSHHRYVCGTGSKSTLMFSCRHLMCCLCLDAQNVIMMLWICMFWAAYAYDNLVYSVTCVNAQLQIFHWGRRNLFWNFSIDAVKVENSVIFNIRMWSNYLR